MGFTIPEQIEYVKDKIIFHLKQATIKLDSGNTFASDKHNEAVDYFNSIVETLSDISTNSSNGITDNNIFLTNIDDIDSMPDNLKKVLKLDKEDELQTQILELFKIAKRPLKLQELIIGLYKKFNYSVEDRNKFGVKLYRMKTAGLIESEHKGVYQLSQKTNKMEQSNTIDN